MLSLYGVEVFYKSNFCQRLKEEKVENA